MLVVYKPLLQPMVQTTALSAIDLPGARFCLLIERPNNESTTNSTMGLSYSPLLAVIHL